MRRWIASAALGGMQFAASLTIAVADDFPSPRLSIWDGMYIGASFGIGQLHSQESITGTSSSTQVFNTLNTFQNSSSFGSVPNQRRIHHSRHKHFKSDRRPARRNWESVVRL
jgi:hypothetical protein